MDFCTLVNSRYLVRVLALHRSFSRHVPDSRLWILCLDTKALDALGRLQLENVTLVPLTELESSFEQLATVKGSRNAFEYLLTCKPFFLWAVLRRLPQQATVAFLDADLFFFADARCLLAEAQQASVLLTGHRLPSDRQHLAVYGRYNAGFVSFRNDQEGRQCLEWWCARVLESCREDLRRGYYYEQRYMDEFPRLGSGIKEATHPGFNVAPWNLVSHSFSLENLALRVDGQPLVFYHFHSLRRLLPWLYDTGIARYCSKPQAFVKRYVYPPYIDELRDVQRALSQLGIRCAGASGSVQRPHLLESRAALLLKELWRPRSLLVHPA